MNPFQKTYSNLGGMQDEEKFKYDPVMAANKKVGAPTSPSWMEQQSQAQPEATTEKPMKGFDKDGNLLPRWAYRDYDIKGNPIKESAYELIPPAKPQEFSGGGGGSVGVGGGWAMPPIDPMKYMDATQRGVYQGLLAEADKKIAKKIADSAIASLGVSLGKRLPQEAKDAAATPMIGANPKPISEWGKPAEQIAEERYGYGSLL